MIRSIARGRRVSGVAKWSALVLLWTPGFGGLAAADDRIGPERCGECHKKEFKAWNASTHSMLLSDSEDEEVLVKSEEIPDRLGIDDIESDAACVGCHFSYYRDEEGEEQLTSIDCESCHGAAAGWVDVHSDYGTRDGAQIERGEDENPTHRAARR